MAIEGLANDAADRVIAQRVKVAIHALGMVLGSGLGPHWPTQVEGSRLLSTMRTLPGFPELVRVQGHAGRAGCWYHDPVCRLRPFLQGRAHYYEHGDATIMKQPIATLKALGCDHILLTNAAGSLRQDVAPGELMMIDDHINWSGRSPLIGVETDDRFVGLTEAYDGQVRANLSKAAAAAGVNLKSGVYAWFSGPNFETPAEIRAVRMLGADAVGMSTVPEVILARWMGMKVAAISTITNYGAGMTGTELSHDETKEVGPIGAKKLIKLIRAYLQAMA